MSIEVIIADSGPLIALARIRHLHLLPAIFGRVVIPAAVLRELTEGAAEGRVGAEDVRSAAWIDVRDADPELSAAFSLIVDRGESEAIALAVRAPSSLLVMDDRRGRRLALDRGLGRASGHGSPRASSSAPRDAHRASAGSEVTEQCTPSVRGLAISSVRRAPA